MEGLSRGNIWKAKNDVVCWRDSRKNKRRVVVNKDEFVEFRYPHDAHFRVDNEGTDLYLYLDEQDFIKNFDYVGKIYHEISFENRHSMKQIIECKLWKDLK